MQFFCTIRSMGGPLTIIDSERKERYYVSTVPATAERLALRAADGGGQLAAIVREPMTGGFEVLIASKRMALVRFRGLVNVQCLIESPDGGLVVAGDAPGGAYSAAPQRGPWSGAAGEGCAHDRGGQAPARY